MSVSEVFIFFSFSLLFSSCITPWNCTCKTGGKSTFQSTPGTQAMRFSLILDGASQRMGYALRHRENVWEKESELSENWGRDSQAKIHVIRTLRCARALNPQIPSWLQAEMLFSPNVLYFVLPGYLTAGWAVLKLESFAISPHSFSLSPSPTLPAPALFIPLPWKR